MPDPHYLARIGSASGLWRLPMDSPAGHVELIATATKLACVILGPLSPHIQSMRDAIPPAETRPLTDTRELLSRYFHGPLFPRALRVDYHPGEEPRMISLVNPCPGVSSIDLDLSVYTLNEIAVYRALLETATGATVSYESLARLAGFPRGARFVGTVMAKNSLPIIIPCHRVIHSDGTIGRYSSGDGIKRLLLEHEHSMIHHGRVVS